VTFSRDKAVRLLTEGRVTIRCREGRLEALVRGDHDIYTVELGSRGPMCSCPSWRRHCSHAQAVALITEGER
jgi:uncharacterized Zn finger protein